MYAASPAATEAPAAIPAIAAPWTSAAITDAAALAVTSSPANARGISTSNKLSQYKASVQQAV